jgi:2',3'-cyclic-nucleotide 2'-phosphodiesterase (5'-nucleotidase family)
MAGLDIFATSDLHNRLTDEIAASIVDARRALAASLLLDCGDAIRAGNLGFSLGGEPILRRMTEMGYHCIALGNREFHPKSGILRKKVKDAGFPVVCANLCPRSPRSGVFMPESSVIVPVGDLTVGVIGLLNEMVTESMITARFSDYVFSDPVEAAAGEADRMADSVDLVIALCHTEREIAGDVARSVNGIRAIVLGHMHRIGPRLEWVEGVPIVSPLPYGEEMAHLRFSFADGAPHVDTAETVRLVP